MESSGSSSVRRVPKPMWRNEDDCRRAGSETLVRWMEGIVDGSCEFAYRDGAEVSRRNVEAEMRRRADCERRGKIGYSGCGEMFAEYLDDLAVP